MLLNLAVEQKRLGYVPVIVSIREWGENERSLENDARQRGLETITFRMLDGPNYIGAWRILRYAWANRFGIIHGHGYKANILFGFIPRAFRRIPMVTTLHGWTNTGRISKIFVYEYLDSLSLKYMDAVCVVNHNMPRHPWLKKLGGALHIIPNGISTLENTLPLPEDEVSEFCKKGYTIASIGRLSEEKGYKYLLEAFRLFLRDVEDGRLLILGEGPERHVLESSIRNKGLSGKVFLPGYRNKAWRYLHDCKVFVLSSLTEGLPITLLEAMQVGIPVISTDVGGIPQVIRHGESGFLVSPGDSESLYAFLEKIYEDGQAGFAMASCAKEFVLREYTSTRMAARYMEVYRGIGNNTFEEMRDNSL